MNITYYEYYNNLENVVEHSMHTNRYQAPGMLCSLILAMLSS